MMNIIANAVYKRIDTEDIFRILWLFPEQDQVVLISLVRKNSSPYFMELSVLQEIIENSTYEEQKTYYTNRVITDENCSMSQITLRDTAWNAIKDFVTSEPDCFEPKYRSKFISSRAKELQVPRMTIQRYLYRYWANGKMKNSLIPDYDKCGGRGKPKTAGILKRGRPVIYQTDNERFNIGEKELKQIGYVMHSFYNKDQKYSLKFTYQKMIELFYTEQDAANPEKRTVKQGYPTFEQFRYHSNKFFDEKKRVGSRKFNKDFRAITGNSMKEALGPGSKYQIDATVGDIYLVAECNRKELIGRPVLYFVTDVFSRMITGFYVGVEGPSWMGAMMALYNTIRDKVALCKAYDIDISSYEWPCEGLPQQFMVDNGEMVSKASNNIIEGLGVDIQNAAAWRPDLKGIVENSFRLLNIQTKALLPGSVQPDFSERGGADYRLDAKLTIRDFTIIVIQYILQHNKRLLGKPPQIDENIMKDGIPAIPLKLWNWGIINRTGRLRQANDDKVKIALMLKDQARVTERGIKFKSICYTCNTAIEEQWFSKARMKGTWIVFIAYDPRMPKLIYIMYEGGQYEECTPTQAYMSLYKNWMLEDIALYEHLLSQQKADFETDSVETLANYSKKVEEVVQKADEASKVITLSSLSGKPNPKNIKENRKEERESIRENEHFVLETDKKMEDDEDAYQVPDENCINFSDALFKKQAEDLEKFEKQEDDGGEQ